VLDGMRVTFAAQSTPRNDPLVWAEERYPGSAGAKKGGRVAAAAF